MNPIVNKVFWRINDDKIDDIAISHNSNENDKNVNEYGIKFCPHYKLKKIIHPSSDWLLYGEFDKRALPELPLHKT